MADGVADGVDAAVAFMDSLPLDIGKRWGEVATAVQRSNAEAVLRSMVDGPAAPVRLFWHELPKGYSKSTDSACLAIVWLLINPVPLAEAYVVSSDEDQSNRLLNRARATIRQARLEHVVKVQAKRIVNQSTGAHVVALAADVASSEGILSPLVICDELPRWPATQAAKDIWASIFSGHPKVPGAVLMVLGHAGDPAHWSYRIRERARVSPRWRFVRVDGPTPWMDAADLAEQEALLLPFQFVQRHLNGWTAGEESLSDESNIRAAARGGFLEPVAGNSYVISVDVGLRSDHTGVAVCHAEPDVVGLRFVVDRVARFRPEPDSPVSLVEVEDVVAAWARRYHVEQLVYDPSQFESSVERLGIPATPFHGSATQQNEMARVVYQAFRDARVSYPDAEALLDDFLGMRITERGPGQVRLSFDRRGREGHGDVAQACVMAMWWLADQPPVAPAHGQRERRRVKRAIEVRMAEGSAARGRRSGRARLSPRREIDLFTDRRIPGGRW